MQTVGAGMSLPHPHCGCGYRSATNILYSGLKFGVQSIDWNNHPCCLLVLSLWLQVCIYCTLLPLSESGVQLPAAVAKFMAAVATQAAVKAGSEQVSAYMSLVSCSPLL